MKFYTCIVLIIAICAIQSFAEEEIKPIDSETIENLSEGIDGDDNLRQKKSPYGAPPPQSLPPQSSSYGAPPSYAPSALQYGKIPTYGGYAPPASRPIYSASSYGAPKPAPLYAVPKPMTGGYSPPIYSAPKPLAYGPPTMTYSYSAPAPTVPCSKNLLFSCSPSVAPVPCMASGGYSPYGSSY